MDTPCDCPVQMRDMPASDTSSPGMSRVPTTMLIADDDPISLLVLKNMFESDFNVVTVDNGAAALDVLKECPEQVCAVLLDYRMPGLDGIQLLEDAVQLNLVSQIPFFLISAETQDQVTKKAYELGVMDVIEKPIVPHVVHRRISSIVELFAARLSLSSVVRRQQEELLRRANQIIAQNRSMIEALATAIEFRDGESGGHVRRIHDITRILLTETSFGDTLAPNQIEDIALASIMHDVGKIAIPDAVLSKPGKLTPEEFEQMKTHTIIGAKMLESIPGTSDIPAFMYARDIASHHHERWDGNGYPDGLCGDQISIWAQVVSLADVYDALLSPRVYKPPLPRSKAIEMINDGSCGAFNPALLEQFETVEPKLFELYRKERKYKE